MDNEETTTSVVKADPEQDKESSGPVAPVLNSTTPIQLSEVDFLKYLLSREKFQKAQLTHDVCVREVQRAEGDLSHVGHLLGQLTRELGQKYGVDLDAMMVSDDGYFMPRPTRMQMPPRRQP